MKILDQDIAQHVLERAEGVCENCKNSNYMLQMHHIIGGRGKRKQHETKESVILLCWECHHGTKGIHGRDGNELDLKLKLDLQDRYFDMGYTEEEVRELMGGKLYENK